MSATTKHSSLKMNSSSKTNQYKHFFIILFLVLVCSIISITLFLSFTSQKRVRFNKIILKNIRSLPETVIKENVPPAYPREAKCTYWNCFNVYQCGHDRLSVYVYPLKKYLDEHGNEATEFMSQEFYTILKTIITSKYYTPDPKKACIFVPSIDTLSQMRIHPNLTSRALNSLPYWNGGENHLLFNMLPGQAPDYSTVLEVNTGRAMLAGAGFNSLSYRAGFDVSLPVFTPSASKPMPKSTVRPWLVVSAQSNLPPHLLAPLRSLARSHREMLVLGACSRTNRNDSERCDATGSRHTYPDVLGRATFCLVARGARLAQAALLDAVAAGCIPVVSADGLVMPFADSLDWKLGALFVPENEMGGLLDRLKTVSDERAAEMQRYIGRWHSHYFADLRRLTLATLETIERRVLPHAHFSHEIAALPSPPSPLFLPITAPRAHGFTAVILTYDRLDSLFLLVEKLARVPSAVKVLVVWNNQNKAPPPPAAWPRIGKPLSITRTSANRLSNRFRPYEEIETEAILTIDDDIVMLTADEVEFGYEVWREFPDRIVGFPSRTHVWDNVTAGWRYESEWTNEISMVLTGAAFHHKYWNHMYTTTLPSDVRDWVDEHMNCEDIAMNFLVANVTNKPPIKVAPRKKFKCPECTNNEMLSADLGHMVERSQCVDRFAKAFGRMPLRSVEFRADPVLYKDPFPEKLKRFNDVGSL